MAGEPAEDWRFETDSGGGPADDSVDMVRDGLKSLERFLTDLEIDVHQARLAIAELRDAIARGQNVESRVASLEKQVDQLSLSSLIPRSWPGRQLRPALRALGYKV